MRPHCGRSGGNAVALPPFAIYLFFNDKSMPVLLLVWQLTMIYLLH